MVTILSCPLAAQVRYFPKDAFGDSAQETEFISDWYSHQLVALKEPSIFEMASIPAAETYRFLWLRTFHHPVAIRVDLKADGTGVVTTKIASGAGGYKPGIITVNQSRKLTPAETHRFHVEIERKDFWSLPARDDRSGEDGAQWIVEGVRAGKYHVVDRWSPRDGAVRELGFFFLNDLARINIPKNEFY